MTRPENERPKPPTPEQIQAEELELAGYLMAQSEVIHAKEDEDKPSMADKAWFAVLQRNERVFMDNPNGTQTEFPPTYEVGITTLSFARHPVPGSGFRHDSPFIKLATSGPGYVDATATSQEDRYIPMARITEAGEIQRRNGFTPDEIDIARASLTMMDALEVNGTLPHLGTDRASIDPHKHLK